MNPLVSIVVPSYQQAPFLRAALESILSQDYAPLEVLALDGGSTDGSREILEGYGGRIWFRSGPDRGQCHAINEGFRRSRGEIVAWLNSDDFYYPGAVAEAVSALHRAPGAALVYGEGNLVDRDGNVLWRFPETAPFDLWRLANHSDYILQPTVFFRRDALFEAGLLDEGLHWGLDWDLWLRLGKRAPFARTDKVLAASRIYGDTKTATGGYRRLGEILRILRRHGAGTLSPAAVAHTLVTVARQGCGGAELLTPEVVAGAVPGPLRGIGAPLVARVERGLRRWLQNVQGVWSDGLAGRRGKLWLPSDGRGGRLEVRGRNLDLAGQRVGLRAGGRRTATGRLGPGEAFALHLEVEPGTVPVRTELRCRRTTEVGPLDPRLGPRRAGCVLEGCRLVPP